MMRLGAVIGGTLVAFAVVLAGCERGTSPTATSKPAQTAASTQPTADEMANVRELVQNLGQRGSEALPAGHPPIGNRPDKPTMPELPTTSRASVTLKYTAPDTWQKEPPKGPLRVDQYRLPRAPGDLEDAELAVFGSNIGGGVEANVQAWRGQFSLPDGQPIPDEGVVLQRLDVNDLKITVVDIAGRYTPRAMMPEAAPPASKDGYRMLGAIVETPGGARFFKAIGPAETIGNHREEFIEFLRSMTAVPSSALQ
jgi:hypothetical protein